MNKRAHSEDADSHCSTTTSSASSSPSPSPSPSRKQQVMDIDSRQCSGAHHKSIVMTCDLPPHRRPYLFHSHRKYEEHYNKQHTNRCLECWRNFPTRHFLDLHIGENHNYIAEARKARGEKTYACFLEDCDKICATPEKRRMHLIDKHHFPRSYDFSVVNDGIDGRFSLLRPANHAHPGPQSDVRVANSPAAGRTALRGETSANRISLQSPPGHAEPTLNDCRADGEDSEDEEVLTIRNDHDNAVDDLIKSISALKFVPQSIRFGKRRAWTGFSKR